MRDIKFRAWDKKRNCWNFTLFEFDADGKLEVISDAEINQFTGLKDKNGDDIYEGDILGQDCAMVDDYTGKPTTETQKMVVIWDAEKSGWAVYCPDAMIKNSWGYVPKGTYIIGNIWENKHLIDDSK